MRRTFRQPRRTRPGCRWRYPCRLRSSSIALAFGKRLRAEPGMQFALVGQPSLSAGDHTVELAFNLPEARTFREKVLYTASGLVRPLEIPAADPPARHEDGGSAGTHASSRRRTRPASPSRTSLAASSPTARRRERFRALEILRARRAPACLRRRRRRISGHPPHRRGRRLAHVARRRIRRRSGRVTGSSSSIIVATAQVTRRPTRAATCQSTTPRTSSPSPTTWVSTGLHSGVTPPEPGSASSWPRRGPTASPG